MERAVFLLALLAIAAGMMGMDGTLQAFFRLLRKLVDGILFCANLVRKETTR